MAKKTILLIFDGLGDLPRGLQTPLMAAKKPNLDRLAQNGAIGLMHTIARGITPGSDTAHLQILGYDPREFYCGRGPLEALGAGIKLKEGDIAFRANFATVDGEMKVLDRRAGRIGTQDARRIEPAIKKIFVDDAVFSFVHTVEHRGAVVLSGSGFSSNIGPTDAHEGEKVPHCLPHDKSHESRKTAQTVTKYTRIAHEKLAALQENRRLEVQGKKPANAVLLRGAGVYRHVQPIGEKYNIKAACVAGGALYKGIARYIGMDVVEVKGATATTRTDLKAKAKAAIAALKTHEFVFVHVKGTDSCGHDGDFDGKKMMIERVDRELIPALAKSGANVVVTGDHSTPTVSKAHSCDPVPLLLYADNIRREGPKASFDEYSCTGGQLGQILGSELMPLMLGYMGKLKKYGT
ncbi:2,3-bisphosphoglycerate-independent phosphoglycerate mutase [Candidatus Parvarchaeota archaeon]|nr:2,3-bisphosphoglycerate-independent phosphoglycerate mutase [Candidatus Parvarchaeota archaeon]